VAEDMGRVYAYVALAFAALPGIFAVVTGQAERKAARRAAADEREERKDTDNRTFAEKQMADLINSMRVERNESAARLADLQKTTDERAAVLMRRIRALEDDFDHMRQRALYWNDKAHRERHYGLNRLTPLVAALERAGLEIRLMPESPELPPFEDEEKFTITPPGGST
jgi:hypothetical protein